MKRFTQIITQICFLITKAVGSVPAFALTILLLIIVFTMLFIQGFQKWNTGVGLFSNTFGSDIELITGIGSMVLLNIQHQKNKDHQKKLDDLHTKIDELHQK